MSSRMSRSYRSSLLIALSRVRSRRATWSRCTRSVVRSNNTRHPFSTRASPRAAERWLLPTPGGPKSRMLAPFANQASPAANAMTWAFETIGTASKSNVMSVLPAGRRASMVTAATQEQRVLQTLLEMAVRTLDRAILVRDTQIVARRGHAVVAHQFRITQRLILRSLTRQVAERRRETVAAMLVRRPAEPPQRVLQSLRQFHIALATKHHMGVLIA